MLRARHSPRRPPSRRCNIIQLVVCTFLPLVLRFFLSHNVQRTRRGDGRFPLTHSLSDTRSFSQCRMTSPFEIFPSRKLLCPQYFNNRPQELEVIIGLEFGTVYVPAPAHSVSPFLVEVERRQYGSGFRKWTSETALAGALLNALAMLSLRSKLFVHAFNFSFLWGFFAVVTLKEHG